MAGGIPDENDFALPAGEDEFAFWPLNLVLLVLGATILGLAFIYLDPADGRLLHNPWSYVVLTPLALIFLSLALNTLVSRVVEKSMQVAFLLSVLVHLLFLIGAMNVVIFSRLWPDILESIAKERHQLKRQTLQARQYYRVTSSTQTGARPDYLRFVPTEHQPTELLESKSRDFSLVDSAQQNLVSPIPRLERVANPHVIEQQKATPSMPQPSEPAARLSRSELQNAIDPANASIPFELLPIVNLPPPLESADLVASRRATSGSQSLERLNDLERLSGEGRAIEIGTSDSLRMSRSQRADPGSDTREPNQAATQLPRSRTASGMEPSSQLPVPNWNYESAETRTPLAPSSQAIGDRVRTLRSADLPAQLNEAIAAPLAIRSRTTEEMSLEKRDFSTPTISSSIGDSLQALPRSTAGGQSGPPAASSMPLHGTELLAGQEVSPELRISPELPTRRRTEAGRSPSSAALLGGPQAPRWKSSPGLSAGLSGISPAELARSAPDGLAPREDVAELLGGESSIQRSQAGVGLVKPPTSSSAGPAPNSDAVAAESKPSPPDASVATPPDIANGRGSRRLNRDSVELPPSLETGETGRAPTSGPSASELAELPARRNEMAVDAMQSTLPSAMAPRAAIANATPVESSISIPLADPSRGQPEVPSARAQMSSVEAGRRDPSQRSVPSNNQLALEAPAGIGGMSSIAERARTLLPRRNERIRDERPPDLEIQRFSRQNVGGPLAAGKVSIPQPAFQQRRERLEDRDPLEETSAEPQTELAIERGLAYLARHQRPDGSWRLQDFDTEVLMYSDTAATGLALLAFQGAGYTHKEFKYAEVCGKAIQFLRSRQLSNGDLYIRQNPASDQNAWLYSHAIAAIAMCEAYGMTQDPELRDSAKLSIDFIVNSQDPQRGGWRYRPGAGSDTSVSGWFMMALKSGQLAGLRVPPATFERLQFFLEGSQSPDGRAYLYRYNPYAADTPQQRHGLQPTPVMTSVGLLMRLYMGWQREKPEMIQGAGFLLQYLPEHGTAENSRRDTYYWYYATQVMFHMGGETWKRWHDSLYPLLIEHQVTHGEHEGSWDPFSPTPDLWARYGGRLYVTTMNLLSLEVTYRHLPLYEATAPLQP